MFCPTGAMLKPSGQVEEGSPRKTLKKGCGVGNEELVPDLEHARKAWAGQKPTKN